jgi:hypothetical protein
LLPELPRPRLDHADPAEFRRGVVRLAEIAANTDDGRELRMARFWASMMSTTALVQL